LGHDVVVSEVLGCGREALEGGPVDVPAALGSAHPLAKQRR
jgi:hypothetical protein